jgi:hypothetical protein
MLMRSARVSLLLYFYHSTIEPITTAHYRPNNINTPTMPRATSKTDTTPTKRAAPYPASSPNSDDQSDTKSQIETPNKKGKGMTWSGEELKQLLHFALNRNGRGWGEAVRGRTANQANQTWT